MSELKDLVERYIAAWNEQDGRRRRELVAKTWIENASYLDPVQKGDGHDGICAMIQIVQEHHPGYRFRLASAIDAHNDRVRFQWEAGGTQDAPLRFVGTDFGVLANDGRFESITGFLDEAPGVVSK